VKFDFSDYPTNQALTNPLRDCAFESHRQTNTDVTFVRDLLPPSDVEFWTGMTRLAGANMFNRVTEPEYCEMRKNILARLASGRLTEDSDLSKVLDSLELVELTMEVEESGVEPAVEIKNVRDFLWLCRAMDFQRQRKGR
jgi:hypothetical protein